MTLPPLLVFTPLNPSQIAAAYAQFLADGTYYIPQLSSPHPLHIDDWKKRELQRWDEYMDNELAKL